MELLLVMFCSMFALAAGMSLLSAKIVGIIVWLFVIRSLKL